MKRTITLLIIASMALSGVAIAQIDYRWTSGTGDWLDAGWLPSNPVWNSDANANIIDGTVNLTPTSRPTNSIRDVYLVPSGGSPVLNISGDLSGRTILLGHEGTTGSATVNQTAGTVTTAGINYIGYKGTSVNTYNLSGGNLVATGTWEFYITRNPGTFGTLNIDGGTLETTADNFALADGTASLVLTNGGSLTQSGAASHFLVGRSGDGVADINTGGTLSSTANWFTLAYNYGSSGILNMNGGTLTHTGADYFFASRRGAGTINMNDGALSSSAKQFVFSYDAAASSTLNMHGGNLTHTASGDGTYFLVGRQGDGTINLDGGTVESSAKEFIIGYNGYGANAGSGVLNLTNGTLKTTGYQFILGKYDDAVATVNVVGGTLECASTYFDFGLRSNTSGTLNLSGGLVKFTGNYFRVGQQANGVVNQTGGTAEIRGLILADNAGSSGRYTISGGSLSVDKYIFGHTANAVFEVEGSGATSIETQSVLFPSGTLRFKLDENGSTLLKAMGGYPAETNVYRGIELTNATVEVETLAGFNGVAGSTYDLMWTTNGFLTNGMTFADNSGIGFEWSIVAKDGGEVFQVMVPGGTPSEKWAIGYGLTGDDVAATADPDGDGINNLYEYGLGGDPTNSADIGIVPMYGTLADGGTNWFEYVYAKRSALDSGLTYYLELTDDLIYTDWANSGYEVVGTGTIDSEFDAVTNRISTAVSDERFIRLMITE